MRPHPSRIAGMITALTLALTAQACDTTNVIGPGNQLEVTNATDSFQWQVTGLDDVSQTLTYTWQNTGTSANVDQSATRTAGSATLRVTDSAGTEVYRRSLAEDGTFTTSVGSAGTWTITVSLSGASGSFNFRVQKP